MKVHPQKSFRDLIKMQNQIKKVKSTWHTNDILDWSKRLQLKTARYEALIVNVHSKEWAISSYPITFDLGVNTFEFACTKKEFVL